MKIIYIVNVLENDKAIKSTYKEVNTLLDFIDKTYKNNAFVKLDTYNFQEKAEYDISDLVEAYNEDDFDYYIVQINTVLSNNHDDIHKNLVSVCEYYNINLNDVLIIFGMDTIKKSIKDIKKFIKE